MYSYPDAEWKLSLALSAASFHHSELQNLDKDDEFGFKQKWLHWKFSERKELKNKLQITN